MMRDDKDRSGKWLIEHHGDALLKLGGVGPLQSWKPLPAEVVQPKQLPDGLIEAIVAGEAVSDLFLVEIFTYPDQRILEQVTRNTLLVYHARRTLPEVLALILHPLGTYRVMGDHALASRRGWASAAVKWRVVELWTVEATDLLAAGDVGLIPWVPLTHIAGPPESVLRECRRRIDQQAAEEERDYLLAVSQILGSLRYDENTLMAIFGRGQSMIDTPLLRKLEEQGIQKGLHRAILRFLTGRFGPVPEDLANLLRSITEEEKLDELVDWAGQCPDLDAFRARLQS
jgi:hypothetical protein